MSLRETVPVVFRETLSGRPAFLAIVFFLALAIRFGLFAWGAGFPADSGDSPSYLAIARSLGAGTGFSLDGASPTASRMPLYPFFLSVTFAIPGAGPGAVKLAQIVLGALTCVLVFFLASNLIDRRHGKIAALFAAVYLPSAFLDLSILSETIFAFLTVAGILVLSGRGPSRSRAAGAGILLGLAALARPNGLITVLFLGVGMLVSRRYRRIAAPFLLAVGVAILPWIARNAALFHRFIPTYTISGLTFYNSYVIPENGLGFNSFRGVPGEYFSLPDEGARDAYLTVLTIRHIREHPGEALSLLPAKLGLLVYPFDFRWLDPRFKLRYNVFWGVLLTLVVAGIAVRRSRLLEHAILWAAPLAGLLFTAMVLYGSPRIRLPFDYLLMIPASAGFVWACERGRWVWMGVLQLAFAVAGICPGLFAWFRDRLAG